MGTLCDPILLPIHLALPWAMEPFDFCLGPLGSLASVAGKVRRPPVHLELFFGLPVAEEEETLLALQHATLSPCSYSSLSTIPSHL